MSQSPDAIASSQKQENYLAAFGQLRVGGTKFVCFGACEQRPPVSNTWRGCSMAPDTFARRRLVELWWPKSFVLARCHRSGAATFEFYCSLPALPLEDAKRLARERFPPREQCD